MISNADVYLTIAEEALAKSKQLDEIARIPKPDGHPGFVITYDPKRTSFKQSLIAIVFAGVYLEALLYIVGVERLGRKSTENTTKRSFGRSVSPTQKHWQHASGLGWRATTWCTKSR